MLGITLRELERMTRRQSEYIVSGFRLELDRFE